VLIAGPDGVIVPGLSPTSFFSNPIKRASCISFTVTRSLKSVCEKNSSVVVTFLPGSAIAARGLLFRGNPPNVRR
jgi:hypothetical protein